MFGEGNVIMFQSPVTGQNIRIFDSEVQGTGGDDDYCTLDPFSIIPGPIVVSDHCLLTCI